LHDRESIINEKPELNVNQTEDPEEPEVKLLEVDNSIFEELFEPSKCAAAIDGIAEVDPMGACLLMLLSKPRPLSILNRDSIPITQIED
jgi:hypothetical protein